MPQYHLSLSGKCVCHFVECYIGHAAEWLKCSWIQSKSYSYKDCLFSNFQYFETAKHGNPQILYSKQLKILEIRFVCN